MTSNQLAYLNLQETERANRAKELETNRANLAKENENIRSNKMNEFISQQKIVADSVKSIPGAGAVAVKLSNLEKSPVNQTLSKAVVQKGFELIDKAKEAKERKKALFSELREKLGISKSKMFPIFHK